MDIFTALLFGMCASVTDPPNADAVLIGYVTSEKCEVSFGIGDTHGQTVSLGGHDYSVDIIDNGAILTMDGHQFLLKVTTGA